MILQALVKYYEQLELLEKVPARGWSMANVSFALSLDADGDLINVIPLMVEEERSGKKTLVPHSMYVPEQIKKSSGIASNFLCENASYLLGIDKKGKPERAIQCFEACRELHEKILADSEDEAAQAVIHYFRNWNPGAAMDHEQLQEYLEEIITKANLVFMYKGELIHTREEIRELWRRYQTKQEEGEIMPCPVAGERLPAARLHPVVKGIRGAQSSGASLVSYNAPAYESYGKTQSYNASVSKRAAFAYTSALNYMINESPYRKQLGDTTIVYWAEGGEECYQDIMSAVCFEEGSEDLTEEDLDSIIEHLLNGETIDRNGIPLKPDKHFYIMGIDPNAARLSIRFFVQDNFGSILNNIEQHYKRLEIVKPEYLKWKRIPMWKLLRETVNPKSKDKVATPIMSGAVLRAVLTNTAYPAALINNIMIRIRAEKDISPEKAAIIKAYWLMHGKDENKEVLNVSVNEASKSVPYTLGRLFAVLETVQEKANPGINTTIKDRYYISASSTPAVIFPLLNRLAISHLKKIGRDKPGLRIYYEQMITELMGKIEMSDQPIPKRLGLEEQGIFNIGYYHQTQERYKKKEKK